MGSMPRLSIWLGIIWIICAVESARLVHRNPQVRPEESTPSPPPEELNLPQQCLARFPQTRPGRFPINGQVSKGEDVFREYSPNLDRYDAQTKDLNLSPDEKSKLQHELKAFEDAYRFSSSAWPPFENFLPQHHEVCMDAFREGFETVWKLGLSSTDALLFIRGYRSTLWWFEGDDREAAKTIAGRRGAELASSDAQRFRADYIAVQARSKCIQRGIEVVRTPPSSLNVDDSVGVKRGWINGIAVGGCTKELRDNSRHPRPDLTPLQLLCEQYLTCIEWWRGHRRANQRFSEGERPVMREGLGPRVLTPPPSKDIVDDTIKSGQHLLDVASEGVKQAIKNPPKLSSSMPQMGFKIPPNVRGRGGAPMIKILPR